MTADDDMDGLDRHALALTMWLPAGAIATTLYHFGVGQGGWPFIIAAFAVIAAAFAGHVVVNVVSRSGFTVRERALALVLYGVALIAFGFATLLSPDFAKRAFLATSAGFVALAAAFVLYMLIRSGVRPAFETFDVIRSFSARDALARGETRE